MRNKKDAKDVQSVVDEPTRQKLLKILVPLTKRSDRTFDLVTKVEDADVVICTALGQPAGTVELIEKSGNRKPVALPHVDELTFEDRIRKVLEKTFRASNLLRVAAKANADVESPIKVEVDILIHKTRNDPGTPAPVESGTPIPRVGNHVSFRIRNTGEQDVDITLLIVGPDCRISRFFPDPLKPGESKKANLKAGTSVDTIVGDVSAPTGLEQMIVIAVKAQNPQADFGSLCQTERSAELAPCFRTPFGQLLDTAAYGGNGPRGVLRLCGFLVRAAGEKAGSRRGSFPAAGR